VRHHLLDVALPGATSRRPDYARLGRAALADIRDRGSCRSCRRTGLYCAPPEGLFEGPSRDEGLRRRLEHVAERFGDERLHRLLARVDPEAGARIPARPRARGAALEVYGDRATHHESQLAAPSAEGLPDAGGRPRPRAREAAGRGRGPPAGCWSRASWRGPGLLALGLARTAAARGHRLPAGSGGGEGPR